jgi:integrase/recombinase XerD
LAGASCLEEEEAMNAIGKVRVLGPLALHVEGLRVELSRLGYALGTAENHIRVMAHLSQWMSDEGVGAGELSQDRVEQFLGVLKTQWKRPPTGRTLAPLLHWLRDRQVIPPVADTRPSTPLDAVVERYHHWLVEDRGLATPTVRRYEATARHFLEKRRTGAGRRMGVEDLSGADVTTFLLGECSRLAVESAKGVVTDLRSLLRFLFLEGLTPTALATAVPPVAGWRDTGLPATVTASDVSALLASCDRSQPTGLRDFAILTLLARLGLRAAEVAGLELGSVDWRAGEIVIRGKGHRVDRLPLPIDVGEALAAYLAEGRPRVGPRALFLTTHPPARAMHPHTISGVVRYACVRAHLTSVGSHRLRHALASELLRRGAALPEIGQVLRHRSLTSTAIYAKVDRVALRAVAQPWPGTGQ